MNEALGHSASLKWCHFDGGERADYNPVAGCVKEVEAAASREAHSDGELRNFEPVRVHVQSRSLARCH